MKELVIISGKGGTGKTSMVSAIASLAENKVLCDADVDAADLHLIMAPEVIKAEPFTGGRKAEIDKNRCIECGLCLKLCRYGAISKDFKVDSIECEGCGVCHYFCPEKAITFEQKTCGEWFISDTRHGPMVHARLGIAEENSGKLVSLVRKESKKIAEESGLDLIITDGAPGVGCPVIASIGGASAVLIVTEPTVSGVHDMKRVAELASFFRIPAMVCVNKYDLNPEKSEDIRNYAETHDIVFVGEIPFDHIFTKAMVEAKTILEYDPGSKTCEKVREIWQKVYDRINN